MGSILQTIVSAFKQKVKEKDRFGKSIGFTFKGEDEFKTFIGGCSAIVILILIIVYAILALKTVFNKQQTNLTASTMVTNLYNDDDPVELGGTDFTFAFSINGFVLSDFKNEKKFSNFNLVSYKYEKNGSGEWVEKEHNVELKSCGSDLFKFEDSEQLAAYALSDYICASSTDFQLMGNNRNPHNAYFRVDIELCTDTSSGCDANMKDDIDGNTLDVLVVNSYFDSSDYEKPIKTYIDEKFSSSIMWGYYRTNNIYISKDAANLQDNVFSVSNEANDENDFIRVNRVDKTLSKISTSGVTLNFYKDETSIEYERTVYTVFDALGAIGGFEGILLTFGGIIVGMFADRLFNYSMISQLFQVDTLVKDSEEEEYKEECRYIADVDMQAIEEHKSNERIHEDHKEPGSENIYSHQVNHEGGDSFEDDPGTSDIRDKLSLKQLYEKMVQDGVTQSEALGRTKVYRHAAKSLKERRAYNYTCGDFAYNLFRCFVFKNFGSKSPNSYYNRYKLYEKGEDKYLNEFDVIYYAKSLRKLQMLVGSLMDDNERVLSNYQHINTISMNNSDSSTDEEDNGNSIPNLINGSDPIKVEHESKIDKFLQEYGQEDWSAKDYKLMYGVFSKKHMTNVMLKEIGVDPDDYEKRPSYQEPSSETKNIKSEKTRRGSNMHDAKKSSRKSSRH